MKCGIARARELAHTHIEHLEHEIRDSSQIETMCLRLGGTHVYRLPTTAESLSQARLERKMFIILFPPLCDSAGSF